MNYLLNQNDELRFLPGGLYDKSLNDDLKLNFKMDFYKKFYEPEFGKIEKLEANTDEEKLSLARTKIKEFMEHNFVKDLNKQDKNLLDIYEIVAKDVSGINFNDS
ncbi:UNVERIFIED_CONTAM: hypothetical protein O8I53_13695 [Campylobacter lari]